MTKLNKNRVCFDKEKPLSYNLLKFCREYKIISLDDEIIINKILVGCSYYIGLFSHTLTKKEAKKWIKNPKKSDAFDNIFSEMIITETEEFRPFDARRKLNYKLKDIESRQLTEILNDFVKRKMLSKSEKVIAKSKRGRKPSSADEEFNSIPGRKSYYKQSSYLKEVHRVISNPILCSLIYSLLAEANLIYLYVKHSFLLLFYVYKFGGKDVFQKARYPKPDSEKNLVTEMFYEKVRNASERRIKKLAIEQSNYLIENLQPFDSYFSHIYYKGALYYNNGTPKINSDIRIDVE